MNRASEMVYVDAMGHVPEWRVLCSLHSRDSATQQSALDLVYDGKGKPPRGDVIGVNK